MLFFGNLSSSQANGLFLIIITSPGVGRMNGRTNCCCFLFFDIITSQWVGFNDRHRPRSW